MKTCVLIPTYNESRMIGELLSEVKNSGHDIVVVDDGSSDNTGKIAHENGAAVIMHKENMGKGASLKSGFAHALVNGYEAVIIMDGDGQHSPKDIERFVKSAKITGADLIIGNRMENPKAMPFIRWATNKCLSHVISKISGQYIPDTQCGFRLIKRRLLEKIILVTSKFETESEMLIRAGRKNFRIHSIPIKSIYNNEVSTIHPLKDAFRFIRLIFKINAEERREKS
ncbi:MAG: glycosyltransferase family 2 protein [Candidatus Omnitrophica bacterium]|nr:glycosyltransferase family 2 protein [Candidatus Omnitrophota bacterium]